MATKTNTTIARLDRALSTIRELITSTTVAAPAAKPAASAVARVYYAPTGKRPKHINPRDVEVLKAITRLRLASPKALQQVLGVGRNVIAGSTFRLRKAKAILSQAADETRRGFSGRQVAQSAGEYRPRTRASKKR